MDVVPSPAVMDRVLSLKVGVKTGGAPGFVPSSNCWNRALISCCLQSHSSFVVTEEPSTLTKGFGSSVTVGRGMLLGREGQPVGVVVAAIQVSLANLGDKGCRRVVDEFPCGSARAGTAAARSSSDGEDFMANYI